MSVKRTWLSEFRHVPRKIKTGMFSSKIVYVLQQKYHDKGLYYSPDVTEFLPTYIDKVGWDYVQSSPAVFCDCDNKTL